jgi:DNA-binding transcriptional ArsR family regulator
MNRHVEQFSALGQKDRLEIFRLLVRAGPEGKCVDEIKRKLKMPGSTLSHHLDTLARSELLNARRSGRFIYYAVDWPEAAKLIRFLTEDCCAEMGARLVRTEALAARRTPDVLKAACCSGQDAAVPNTARQAPASKS